MTSVPKNSRERRDADNRGQALTECPACGKKTYKTRKAAKSAAKRLYPDDHLSTYQCRSTSPLRPNPAPWHFGHLDERIMTGEMGRRAAYNPTQYKSNKDGVKAIQRMAKNIKVT